MRYLLDTHVLLWYFEGSSKLPYRIKQVIKNQYEQKFVSVASLWEFSIKVGIGKLQFDGGVIALWDMLVKYGFTILPIRKSYLDRLICLPFIHRDSFDRLLIATAIEEKVTILSADANIQQYDIQWEWD
jgi:PIN domain nuclease of toxin-antitoxin system